MCPAGHEAVSEYEDEEAPERVEMHFAREVCEPCWLRPTVSREVASSA